MKESKKVILGIMKKHLKKNDKFESQVLNLTLKKINGARKCPTARHRSVRSNSCTMTTNCDLAADFCQH